MQRWQGVEQQRRLLLRDREDSRAGRVADTVVSMAKRLERDPQVESILRNRKAQLGLGDMPAPSVSRALADMIGR